MIMETPSHCKFQAGERKLMRLPTPDGDMQFPQTLHDVVILDTHRTKPLYLVAMFGTRDVMQDVPEEALLPINLLDEYKKLVAAETIQSRRMATEFLDWYRLNLDRYEGRPIESVVEAFCGRKQAPPSIIIGD